MPFYCTILDSDGKKIEAWHYVYDDYWMVRRTEFVTEFSLHFVKCIMNLLGNFEMHPASLTLKDQERHFARAEFFSKLTFSGGTPEHISEVIKQAEYTKALLQEESKHGDKYDGLRYFMLNLTAHPGFNSVYNANNQLVFQEIKTITDKKGFMRSDCYRLSELLGKLTIPGIRSIKLESNLSSYESFLEKIDFPCELIPESFQHLLSNKDETVYPLAMQIWFSKIKYLHTAFKDKQFEKKCHQFAKFANEPEFSLAEFREDLKYILTQEQNKGIYVRNKVSKLKAGCLFTKPLPPLHRCLKMLSQHKLDEMDVSAEDIELVQSVYKVDLSTWFLSPSKLFQFEMGKLFPAYVRSPVSVKTIMDKIKTKSASNYIYNSLMDSSLCVDEGINEVLRRIRPEKIASIQVKLNEVTEKEVALFNAWLKNPKDMLTADSFVHDPMFPFTALYALRQGEISTYQFGTSMSFWGSLPDIFNQYLVSGSPEFVPLFLDTGETNPQASDLFLASINVEGLPFFIEKPDTYLEDFFKNAQLLPLSEQGFWIVQRNSISHAVTIKTTIKNSVFRFLDFVDGGSLELLTTFGVHQAFVDAAFLAPVRLNPVIGSSTTADIKKCSLLRFRDIQVPFYNVPCPKTADHLPSPRVEDFIYHDRYHQVRASRVSPEETAMIVAMGERLEKMQLHYKAAASILEKIHTDNVLLLRVFFAEFKKNDAFGRLPLVLKYAYQEFTKETKLIAYCSKLALLFGKLKFRLYDMERGANGTYAGKSKLDLTFQAIASIEADLYALQILHKIPPMFAKIVGHVAYDHYGLNEMNAQQRTGILNAMGHIPFGGIGSSIGFRHSIFERSTDASHRETRKQQISLLTSLQIGF